MLSTGATTLVALWGEDPARPSSAAYQQMASAIVGDLQGTLGSGIPIRPRGQLTRHPERQKINLSLQCAG
jgi:hypothetical protein